MDITKILFRRNRPVVQPEQDGSAGCGRYQEGQAWQEIKNKKQRKTEEAKNTCPYKT